ncbi:S1 RNA-binding domain-containing protein [Streptomyces sp. SDr-06]|uniref:S1 RNA-binding domain-containing protein n=1 Tax=Streptomyces sp. SDr-06 TaxID=2267702 RepID=UPI0016719742|nr:S1 RNA-binding domain-containing protein [Streptomyces sp. SDr-06]
MCIRLHQELDAIVVKVQPWGLEVEFGNGTQGLIDNMKDPMWPSGDRSSIIGEEIKVVVIDDQREPVRLSALDADLNTARMKRSATNE